MKKFRLNRKGFTLIELLAVITILGILMLILIPSVSRIIENSRKNTFLSTAKNYANAVRDAWSGDQLYCLKDGGEETETPHLASSLSTGTFIVMVASANEGYKYDGIGNEYGSKANAIQNFKQLINSGGRSSWGNNEIGGYVKVVVTAETVQIAGKNDTTQLYTYYVELIDTQGHGLPMGSVQIDSVLRQSIVTTDGAQVAPTGDPLYYCLVS